MPDTPLSLLAAAVCLAPLAAPAGPPDPQEIVRARAAPRFDPAARCPGLRPAIAEEQPAALVVFRVGVTGVPSQPSVRSSSRSQDLDAAAVSCVLKLRFLPATRLGDGTAIESLQEMALQWVRPRSPPAPDPSARAAANAAAASRTEAPPAGGGGAVVRACVDETGKLIAEPILIQSSGNPGFDQAALRVAHSGASAYRPAPGGGSAPPGCLRLTISPDTR